MNNKLKIVISGGGTGGHVFPAIAIAEKIKIGHPDADILFVGALGKLEMEKVPAAGFQIIGLPIQGFQRKISVKNIILIFKLLKSILMAHRIIRNFKPDVAIGVGGYASGPLLRVAAWHKIPILIQEQNSYPGVTNRILAKRASKICVAYPGMDKYFKAHKIIISGNPVRENIINNNITKEQACSFFNLNPSKITILSIGGSLGAGTINNSLLVNIQKIIQNPNLQLIWQTGKTYFDNIQNKTSELNSNQIKIMPFIKEMDMAYAAADIIISRAGAIAISELCLLGKPVIFVPSPNVAEDHQTKNAMVLVNANAGKMVPDIQAESMLVDEVVNLAFNNELKVIYSQNIVTLAKNNATDIIADEIIKLSKK